ncbi:uncharacterized protein RJT21DRAFT_3476 [Scheffersomyces amazonensis]|uniref:uncharacterized protein n=1 Tax=Scheffersomyces amazonensis TaxID=1078765 RepID=UPI00315D93C2
MAGDLNLKKSWNPALVKNQKKVWQEEQNKLAEFKQIEKLEDEFKSEQEYKHLLKLQYGDDFKVSDLKGKEKLKLNKLSWMYDDMPKTDEAEVENEAGFIESKEFTEGKNEVENLLNGNKSFNKTSGTTTTSLDNILNVGRGGIKQSVVSDDPLLKIRQEKRKQMSSNKLSASRHSHRSRERDSSSARSDKDKPYKVRKESSPSHSHRSSSSSTSRHHHHHSSHSSHSSHSTHSSSNAPKERYIPKY